MVIPEGEIEIAEQKAQVLLKELMKMGIDEAEVKVPQTDYTLTNLLKSLVAGKENYDLDVKFFDLFD